MKIIDQQKDYYDYLQNIYGYDGRLVYNRGADILEVPDMSTMKHIRYVRENNTLNYLKSGKPVYGYLVVYDDLYLVKMDADDATPARCKYAKLMLATPNELIESLEYRRSVWYVHTVKDGNTPILRNGMKPLAIEVGQPVFAVIPSGFKPVAFVPRLRAIGTDNRFLETAESIYQKIELFLGEIRDTMVEPATPNDIKIQQAGFDLKQSFRHRK